MNLEAIIIEQKKLTRQRKLENYFQNNSLLMEVGEHLP